MLQLKDLKHLKISFQLKLGFVAMLFFVIVMGIVSYIMCNEIQLQVETMYDHPLQVRRALGTLRADILTMQRDMKTLIGTSDDKERMSELEKLEVSKAVAAEQLTIIADKYLGPRADIEALKQNFIIWDSMCAESVRLIRSGNAKEAYNRGLSTGVEHRQGDLLFAALQKVDNFAIRKADLLYAATRKLSDALNWQLAIIVFIILLLAVIINIVLLRSILIPLAELTDVTRRFQQGELDARCWYESKNELGTLSASFNTLAETIQQNNNLSDKVTSFSRLILNEDDAGKFFHDVLTALSMHTDSPIVAAYLRSEDKTAFEHFYSIGLDKCAKQQFAADAGEGEFGAVLASRKMQHLKNIPQDSCFVFNAVCGKFMPREIITIPLLAGDEIIAIISLGSLGIYNQASLKFIDSIVDTLSARVEGILTHRKLEAFSARLEQQNHELEAQKAELSSQSAELLAQNAELEKQKKQLNETSQLKTVFLSNMSHELRTPLNSVIALSGVLSRRLVNQIPQDEYSYLEIIERNGKHLLGLINDILDISRIEAGYEEVELTRFDANALIAELTSMINPQAEQKQIELLHHAGEAELFIISDADKCRHILQNLMGNAVKFTDKGKVEITASLRGDQLEIVVKDTGIGIAEDHLAHIFDKFRQADGSTSRRFGGSGLGLSIARELATLLTGTITVKSVPGQGSEFTLTLPLRYAGVETAMTTEFPKPPKPATGKPAAWSSAKTILLVEDSEPAIIQLKEILEDSGYLTLVARNGDEALKIIDKVIPDAMILDLMMPGVDGFEVLGTLRSAEPTAHIPVLILTAKHISKEELKKLKRNNIHQLIQKGNVNRNELLNSVAAMAFPEPVKPQVKPPAFTGKPVVLAVEDNPDNMITVKALLADDYTIVEAANGAECVVQAQKCLPNLILMDIALPGMDGIEAFRTIRKLPELQHVPVIALTASAMLNDRETILAQGFDAYISKPIDNHIFFKTIREALYGK